MQTAHDFGTPLRIVETVAAVNDQRKRAMARKVIAACGGSVRGGTIAVLGLTFKPNTDDMREAPSIALITALQDAGAKVRAYDPEGMKQARAGWKTSSTPSTPMPASMGRTRWSSSPSGTPFARSTSIGSNPCSSVPSSSTCATSTGRRTWRDAASPTWASVAPACRKAHMSGKRASPRAQAQLGRRPGYRCR